MIYIGIKSIYYDLLYYKCRLYKSNNFGLVGVLKYPPGDVVRRLCYNTTHQLHWPEAIYTKYGIFK